MAQARPSEKSVEHIFTDIELSPDIGLRDEALERLVRRIQEVPVDTREALADFKPGGDASSTLGRLIRAVWNQSATSIQCQWIADQGYYAIP